MNTETLEFPPIDAAAAPAPAPQSDLKTEVIDGGEVIDRAEINEGRPLVAYSRTEAALADLRKRHAGVVYDLTTTLGNAQARAARQELVKLRTGLEAKRKQFKAPALAFSAAIDSEAKRITAEIVALEAPIDDQIKSDEARREAIRVEAARVAAEAAAAEERAEAERRQRLEDGIATIAGYVVKANGKSAAAIASVVTYCEGIQIHESHWGEYTERATAMRACTIETLIAMQKEAEQREQEAARLEAQRVEQERIAAEQRAEAQRLAEQAAEIRRQADELEAAEHARIKARADEARAAEEAKRKAEAEEAQRLAAAETEAQQVIAAAQAVRQTTETAIAEPASESEIAAVSPPAPAPSTEFVEPATVRLGSINNELGFDLTANFVKTALKVECKRAGAAALYTPPQRVVILRALIVHIEGLL